jgi:Flp pilus assembly protein TadD
MHVPDPGAIMVVRALGLLIGIGHLLVIWVGLRLLFAGQHAKQIWGILFASCLPPLLFLSQYVTNEPLSAALASTSLVVALCLLRKSGSSWRLEVLLGFCIGAALLAKSTNLILIPSVIGALCWKRFFANGSASTCQSADSIGPHQAGAETYGEMSTSPSSSMITMDVTARQIAGRAGAGGRRWMAGVVLILAISAATCGWHYGRVWMRFGNPLIGNWDPKLPFRYWQDPGYGIRENYLRFGACLSDPWFSGFNGFPDAMYSTFWGDGLYSGEVQTKSRPPWNFELMSIGYWLALLPSLALVLGAVMAIRSFLRRPTAEWFMLLATAFLACLAVVYMNVMAPAYSTKSFYALPALLVFCAAGAIGWQTLLGWISRESKAGEVGNLEKGRLNCIGRAIIWVVFGTWAITSYCSFWILRSSIALGCSQAVALMESGRSSEAENVLLRRLAANPESASLRCLLASILNSSGDAAGAATQASKVLESNPDYTAAHFELATALDVLQSGAEALVHARRATTLAPTFGPSWRLLAQLLFRAESYEQAASAAREGLACTPYDPDLRFVLGCSETALGQSPEADEQLDLAFKIKPNWPVAHGQLGIILLRQGQHERAVSEFNEAIRLDPTNGMAHCRLAIARDAQHHPEQAIEEYLNAIQLMPDCVPALNNFAWIRATHPESKFRNGAEAVRLATGACQATGEREPIYLGTLAAAYAEAGRFEEAVAAATKARDLALLTGDADLAEKNRKLIQQFTARQPFRDSLGPGPASK